MPNLFVDNQGYLRENYKAIKLLEKFGDMGQYAIPATIGVYALLSGNAVEALAMGCLGGVQYLEVFSIKKHFPRNRPEPYVIGKISREDTESFPSSHTGGAFLGVGLAYGLYDATSLITITSIALASLVGISRCLSKKHWPTDVIVGAMIGGIHGFASSQIRYVVGI